METVAFAARGSDLNGPWFASCTRLLGFEGRVDHPIADAANGLQIIARFAELLAQAIDVGIDGASLQRGLNFPHFLQKLLASLDPSEPAHQEMQEAKLQQVHPNVCPFHRAPRYDTGQ